VVGVENGLRTTGLPLELPERHWTATLGMRAGCDAPQHATVRHELGPDDAVTAWVVGPGRVAGPPGARAGPGSRRRSGRPAGQRVGCRCPVRRDGRHVVAGSVRAGAGVGCGGVRASRAVPRPGVGAQRVPADRQADHGGEGGGEQGR
jgi:hypothetical protein